MSDSTSRSAILGRIRQALKSPAPEPHWTHEPVDNGPLFPLPNADNREANMSRFREEFAAVQGEWHEVDSVAAARDWVANWSGATAGQGILAVEHPLVRRVLELENSKSNGVVWCGPNNPSRAGWENLELGVTPCEALICESGTVVVSTGIAGRAPSVLPPVHLVIATANQFVPDIETALAGLRAKYGSTLPSSISLITGPSRTGDIEKILVLGAHGPRRLAVLLLHSDQ